jgi:predicted transcriptional regulator
MQNEEIEKIDPDVQNFIFQKGWKARGEHNTPSPETLKRLSQMSEDITQLKVGQTRIETKVDNIIETLKSHINDESEYRRQQDAFHKEIMEKKANVWVEKAIVGVVIFVFTAVGASLLGLILIK